MKTRIAVFAAIVACCTSRAADDPTGVEVLAWFQGCWESRNGEVTTSEQWMRPAGKSMLGMSRTVKGGSTVGYEFIRVWEDENGSIFFTAKPSGQPEASFRLVRATDQEAFFENPDHDFPQRIIYRLTSPDRLEPRIEGSESGKPLAIDFSFQRVACGGPRAA